jgi:hypothetical protein
MSKRTSKPSIERVDLDDELSRRQPQPAGLAIRKDNWKISSDKARNDPDWNNTKKSLGLDSSKDLGFWEYSKDGKEKFWVDERKQAVETEHSLEPAERHGPFPTFDEDKQISEIYHRYWLKGNAEGFIDAIYR